MPFLGYPFLITIFSFYVVCVFFEIYALFCKLCLSHSMVFSSCNIYWGCLAFKKKVIF